MPLKFPIRSCRTRQLLSKMAHLPKVKTPKRNPRLLNTQQRVRRQRMRRTETVVFSSGAPDADSDSITLTVSVEENMLLSCDNIDDPFTSVDRNKPLSETSTLPEIASYYQQADREGRWTCGLCKRWKYTPEKVSQQTMPVVQTVRLSRPDLM